jgi:hypothetical protein
VSATVAPSAAVIDVLYVDSMVSANGAAFVAASNYPAVESMSDGTASAGLSTRKELTTGTSYVFGAGMSANTRRASTGRSVRPQ